jgi:hypothetical protein
MAARSLRELLLPMMAYGTDSLTIPVMIEAVCGI